MNIDGYVLVYSVDSEKRSALRLNTLSVIIVGWILR